MKVAHSKNRRLNPSDAAIADVLRGVSQDNLRAYVDLLAFPRHYVAERKANEHARDLLLKVLRSFGYAPEFQGTYDNIVISSGGAEDGPFLLPSRQVPGENLVIGAAAV